MHIALIGGPATGKTTLAKTLQEAAPGLFYAYMSKYAARIPMSLQATTHPRILNYSLKKYINTIVSNQDAEELKFTRAEMDEYGRKAIERHGATIIGKTALAVAPASRSAIFDNIATAASVTLLKNKGVYIVGLQCAFETQVKRRLENPRDIDPKERSELEKQLHNTPRLFQTELCLQLAHVTYDTDRMRPDEIAREILLPIIR